MEGRQFSTSRNVVIHVGEFLDRYSPDSLRYYLTAAGPETHDTDFTWAEFVRRNNDELVATWGNLVNRTLHSAFKNFGTVPVPGDLREGDRAVIAAVDAGFKTVGGEIEKARFRAALAQAMALAARVNQYVSTEAPWAALESDRTRAGTILYVALRCVDSLKILLTPFLPHSSQKLHALLGYDGWIAGPLDFREIAEVEGAAHTVLTGDYASWTGRWEPSRLPPGQPLTKPSPLFAKLDPASVVSSELDRMERAATP
jgi:methionyl-tRNA synthetase